MSNAEDQPQHTLVVQRGGGNQDINVKRRIARPKGSMSDDGVVSEYLHLLNGLLAMRHRTLDPSH